MAKTLITAALPYVNSYIHLGHLAGAYLPADMYARFLRLKGREVLFVCGSDEHGVAITISAEKEQTTPKAIIDKYHPMNEQAFKEFGMSFDIYSRTSLPEHFETASEFFLDWLEKGLLIEKEEPQFYDETAQMFLPDRYVEGECPHCKKEGARGDQCDNCGATYNQTELINPISVLSKKAPIVKITKHWYFKMGDFQHVLEEYIETHAKDWKDNVVQQSRSWLKQGLADRAATRDMSWGIPVPVAGAEGKVIYVWFEAVLGYISATKHWAMQKGLDKDAWKEWWSTPSNEDREYIAFLGKDNIVFHTLIFPMLLMAKGNMILPTNVPANEFLNFEGKKFSKSQNWGIFLRDYQKDFPGKTHTDMLRYALATNLPETKDSDFTWKDFQAKTNNELAAIPGNFINRVTQFLQKNFDGKVPVLPERYAKLEEAWSMLIDDFKRESSTITKEELQEKYASQHLRYFSSHDIALIASLYAGMNLIAEHYATFHFRDAVTETMNIARAANKYFNDTEPWKTIKNDHDECSKTLYICTQILHAFSVVFAPIIPNTARTLSECLGVQAHTGDVDEISEDIWSRMPLPVLRQGQSIQTPPILFTKLEDTVIESQIEAMGAKDKHIEEDVITIDDVKKVKLRTAKIISAEAVPKSEKLLKLKVDLGFEQRQILAGIAKHYKPEDIVGKMIVVVANLKPAKLMGQESQGMLLAANSEDGSLGLIIPETDILGSEVR